MRKIFRVVSAAAVIAIAPIAPAGATSGLLFWCSDVHPCGMAGAGIARHGMAGAAMANPAGIARSENSAHIGAGWIAYMPTTVDYEDQNGFGLVNDSFEQTSAKTMFYEAMFGISYRLNEDWVVALAGGGSGGLGAKYAVPRFTAAATGDVLGDKGYDTQAYLGILSFYPTLAWTPSKELSLGASIILGHEMFKSDSAVFKEADAIPGPDIVQTDGHRKMEHAHGAGFRLGFIWDINPQWSVGGAAQTPTWFEQLRKYEDMLMGPINVPAYTQLGVVWRAPDHKFLLALDFRYQFYRFEKILNTTPENGGFGWGDTKEVAFGGTYFLNPQWELLAGVNWSPMNIEDNEIFANSRAPLVDTWKFDAGFAYRTGENFRHHIDFDAYYVVPDDIREDGTGGFVSQIGKGTKIGHNMAGLRAGYTYEY